jgi:hypothetical protein
VPSSGIGEETIAIVKIDLQLINADGRWQERIQALARETQSDWGPFSKMIGAMSSNGVSQIAIPVNFGPSMLETLGIYLRCSSPARNEDLETALIGAGGGSMLAAAALMAAITDTAGGWKFWGVGGGEVSSVSGSTARRYEDAFKQGGAAPLQVVVLTPAEDLLGEINPQPSDPRLLRQVGGLLKAAKDMESMRVAIVPDGAGLVAGALFKSEASAAAFVGKWADISRDLQLAAGSDSSAGDQPFAALLERVGHLAPRAEGRWVRWGP